MPPANDFQALLAEDRWIRRLAAQLVADSSSADDLVQEAYLTALSGAARPRSARAWLGGVVRNLWRDGARSGARRERRERVAARAEALPASAELVAEVELRKRVAEAVLALDEPLRRTVVLRFFQDRSLAEIAAAEGLSVSSVHERLQRALARLRIELDRTHGGRRESWAATMITLVPKASAGAGTWEAVAMASALKVAVSVLVVGAGTAWWWSAHGRDGGPSVVSGPSRPVVAAEHDDEVALVPTPVARQALVPEAPPPAPAVPVESATITGRVLDPTGRGLSGARIGWSKGGEDDEPVQSGPDGAFELELAGRSLEQEGIVACQSPELVTLVFGSLFGNWMLVAAPRAHFAGTVVDESGAPIAGAELEFRLKETLFRAVGMHALGLDDMGWRTSSDSNGRFELRDVAGGTNVALAARARGFVAAEITLPEGGDLALVLTLQRAPAALELRGIVLDPSGHPVPEASVSAGEEIVTTGADGRFTLLWDGGNGNVVKDEDGTWREEGTEHSSVIALKDGYRPAQESLRERDLGAPFVLQLGPPLSITGFVREPEGEPRAGIVMWLQDPTRFGRELLTLAGGTEIGHGYTVEDKLSARSEPAAISAADGSFEIGFLMDRSYSVLAFDPRTAARCGPWSVAAGTHDVELVFTTESTRRVAGRIVSARGKPRVGLEVTPHRSQSWADGAEAPQLVGATYGTKTDAEGRFAFEQLATTGTSLLLASPPFGFRIFELDDSSDLANLEIVEPDQCEVQVELASHPTSADTVKFLDESGLELELHEVSGGGNTVAFTMEPEVRLVDGRSRLLFVPETARTLVLFKAEEEVLRLPIELEPGRRIVLRP